MAMVGNRFGASGVLPEQVMSPNLEQPVLTLPERPRELVLVSNDKSSNLDDDRRSRRNGSLRFESIFKASASPAQADLSTQPIKFMQLQYFYY